MPNAIEQIYDQLATVFGGTNPKQVFTMMMPGITLDPKSYSYDTKGLKPATVQEAESRLVDYLYDIAKVSGGNNGQRVSNQYLQALSALVPKFNPMMPVLKKTLRDFLNTPVPDNTMLDGEAFKGTMQQYYFKLYDGYIATKLTWEQKLVAKKEELAANPDTANEQFLEWYEQIAEAELAKIDEALAKVLGVFAPSDMDAILGALAAGPGGEIQEAANTVKDIQLASPSGGFFYPVDLTPDDWFLDLISDENPVNLLQDPAFIAQSVSAKRQALMASISQVQNLLSNMPTKGDIKNASDALQAAQKSYTDAQNNLLNTYADNTATAVEIYLSKYSAGNAPDDATAKSELDANAVKVSQAKGETPTATGAKTKLGAPITTADVQKLVNGQKTLISAQSSLQTTSQALADAGVTLGSEESSYFGDLPMFLSRLQAQLSDLNNLQSNLAASISANGANALPVLGPTMPAASVALAKTALTQAQGVAAGNNPTVTSVSGAATTAIGSNTDLAPLVTAIGQIAVSPADILTAMTNALSSVADADKAHAQAMLDAATTAATQDGATGATVKAAVTAVTPVVQSMLDACNNAAPTVDDVIALISNYISTLPATVVKKSDASERFMDLQLSFSKSDMSAKSSQDSSFTQTSWSVDLFFGSASGSSSSSSSVTADNSMDSSTEIQIGLKAARVDIERGWFDPGVFMLTKDMNNIAGKPVSQGTVTQTDDQGNTFFDWTKANNLGDAILPSFPVSFLVVKDVNITFKASSSSLDAIHSVLDQKSAAGGGFLCFSVSSSSSSHSDHQSVTTRSEGNVININMPGPQILGWFLETTPQDYSQPLTAGASGDGKDITILEFINKLTTIQKDAKGSTPGVLKAA